ncbi:MAG: SDR family NAD(P)-dependent oxidoreductase [Deltaproteobacteria bacterium]|nr:SDR family NAD(P)-dependent oxidoreductase [Deltaproteobacteria bacterium]
MNDKIKDLYKLIREQKVSNEDAIKQIKSAIHIDDEITPSLDLWNANPTVSEIYIYDEPYLRDHTVYDEQVLLGVTHGSLAINTFFSLFPEESSVHLHKLTFFKPVEVKKDQQVEVIVDSIGKGSGTDFQVLYRYAPSETWNLTANGSLQKTVLENQETDVENLKESLTEFNDINKIYTKNSVVGLGESFKTITQIFTGNDQVLARVKLSKTSLEENHKYALHPLIINSAFLSLSPLLIFMGLEEGFLPFGIKNVFFKKHSADGIEQCWLLTKLVKKSGEMILFDVDVINDESKVIANFTGCSIKRLRPVNQGVANDSKTSALTELKPQLMEKNNPIRNATNLSGKIQKYLIKKLGKIVSDSSKLSDLSVNLMDLGVESTQFVAMATEIEKETKIELYPTLFFEYPSIKELIGYFDQEHQDSFIQLFGVSKKTKVSDAVNKTVGITSLKPAQNNSRVSDTGLKKVERIQKVASKPSHSNDIAVIGLNGNFAEASNVNQFWNNLRDKKNLMKEIPIDHWDYRPWYNENPNTTNMTYCKWGSFIDDVDKFDASFFNISPREAEWMDPQLRLLLQSIYATGEDAGCINQLRGTNTGVFIGVCFHDYGDKIAEMNIPVDPYSGSGNASTVIANRVSFLFDFTGPSIAVDTACSSSLVALHNACQAIRNNECDMAFAGGANLLLSSLHYRYFCSIGALSPTGRCHTFDKDADGYTPGECIASVLLKPLDHAKRDGDQIYAIIKGSAALHGGYTPSFTAPSVAGEENVILKAWENAGIDPETISYIEAHGTGTKLGDPIEVNSLKKAFKHFTKKEHFCAIGSAKANIGHTEGAAGIAGLLKVILQMKHQQIPALPFFKKLNPYIQLDKSPLYINTENGEWQSPEGVPRRAGVSSFGFSGAYAHVVVEEYISENTTRDQIFLTNENPALIVLSAKNEDRLKEQAKQLQEAIIEREFSDASLSDIAYTLQIGREAMEERLAMIVVNIEELEEKLNRFLDGNDDDIYRGQLKHNEDAITVFDADEELQEAIEKWIIRKKYTKLLSLWVKGLLFDWNKLYGDVKPIRISLPTYPFALERYWIPENTTSAGNKAGTGIASFLHPLLHQNTSNFEKQRYSSTFTGEEFFLKDHVVKGQRILPGVAFLEMAQAAVKQTTGTLNEGETGVLLKNVVWIRPIVVGDEKVQVHIGLFPEDNGEIAYEIYCDSGKGDVKVYSQGNALLCIPAETTIDIKTIQEECNQSVFTSTKCYEAFKSMGLEYGPGHQGIENVYVGENQVLSKLVLPSTVLDTKDQYVLHPGIFDSALQSAIGFMLGSVDSENTPQDKPALPFALQEIEILSNCTANMWAWVRDSTGSKPEHNIQKLDIDLCDENGIVCVRMKGFSSRVLVGEVEFPESSSTVGTLMIEPQWKEQEISMDIEVVECTEHLVLLSDPEYFALESFEKDMKDVNIIVMCSKEKSIPERFEEYAFQTFEKIQRIIKEKPSGRVFIQVVISPGIEEKLFCGLSGLLKTTELENPKITGQIIELDNSKDIVKILQENIRTPYERHIKYENGMRYTASFVEVESSEEVKIPWKDKGIYLITGGAGGLGNIFAKEILTKVKNTTLILTGRSKLGEDVIDRLKEELLGARIDYRQVDVTNAQSVIDLKQSIQEEYGELNGIIHSAGVVRDNFILKKTREEFEEVLAPKVTGLVNLDEACKNMPLDFFILFSSVVGSMGNIGQADYACANAFMDAYARYRNLLVSSNVRHGKTLSINWPLWKNGGMSVDKETEQKIMQSTGIIPMYTASGINALYQSFSSGRDQVVILEGNVDLIKEKQLLISTAKPMHAVTASNIEITEKISVSDNSLQEEVVEFIKKIISEVIKISPEKIQLETPFEKYGIDSISQLNLIQELEKVTGEVSKSLLFEYSTVQELADYLIKYYSEKFSKFRKVEKGEAQNSKKNILINSTGSKHSHFQKKNRFQRLNESNQLSIDSKTDDIAIIGISGRYPLSNTMEEFWANLKAGSNCITEVSSNRWNTLLSGKTSGLEYQYPEKKYYGGFLDNINRFDHSLFEISQDQVMDLSPELRLFLETVWETFEDAGYARLAIQDIQARYEMGVGVFVGTMYSQYSWNMPSLEMAGLHSNGSDWQIANRTSHFFNLTGPSIAVNSACSSSLTAIHLACESLKQKTCSMCIAGGINLTLDPSKYDALGHLNFLGSGNKSKSFGTGDGYIPGEGVGAVLLKPLSMAIKDHDRIYAVIKSSFINHSGGRQMYAAPDPKQQTQLIINSIKRSGIDPETIGYVESAANGSPLGDPIEIIALNNAFEQYSDKKQYCAIGSVKSNLGHLEAVSGISQLSKVLMQLKHQTLVPTINASPRNPGINIDNTAFYFQEKTETWNQIKDPLSGSALPRRSMVNSFGAGGAYGNLIIEEYAGEVVIQESSISFSQEFLIVFSAKTEWSLMKYIDKIRVFIEKNSNLKIADITAALHKTNHNLDQRVAIVASSISELLEKINSFHERSTFIDSDIYISFNQETNTNIISSSSINQALENKNLRKLAEYWVADGTIDFTHLYKDLRTQWITLPKYCFDHNIEFDFNLNEEFENNRVMKFDDDFFRDLYERVLKDELSEEQVKNIIMASE